MKGIAKYYLLFLLLTAAFSTKAQQAAPVDTLADGPYVFYRGGQLLVVALDKAGDLLQPTVMRYPLTDRSRVTLQVAPEGHPEWGFSVRLRDTLINDPVVYPAAGKCLFISDIEGEFANFRKLLLAAGVIDEHYNWIYGKGSLVIPGDLFDRGKDVVPELWLLYKLEDEARAAGGACLTIIGNHDQMNLSGDHRYTDARYFKNAWVLGTAIDGLFGKDTELGRWLRTKNVIEKIGGVLVMHGGMSPAVLGRHLSLEQLNTYSRPWYDAARKAIPDSLQLLFGRDALFWYRGYFMQPKATMGLVDSTLKEYNCKWILVGHTIVKWNIASYDGGKVIGIDVDEHSGNTQAALLAGGKWYVTDADGKLRPLVYRPANDEVTDKDIL
jgi:hypothetical protein